MVIGFFCDAFPPLMDGVGNVVLNYALNLIEMGHEVHLITGNFADAVENEFDKKNGWNFVRRLPVIKFKLAEPYGIVICPKKIYREIYNIPFDIIHVHSPFFVGKLGRKIAKKKGVPLVCSLHSQFKYDILSATRGNKLLTKIVLDSIVKEFSKSDRIWAVSSSTREVFKQPPYNFKKDIEVVDNATDLVKPEEEELKRIQDKVIQIMGEKPDVPIFIFVGQHHDKKNIPYILEAVKIVSQKGIGLRLVLVGNGPHEDKYKEFVKKNNLEKQITFLGRITDREVVAGIFSLSHMLLFPSYYDSSCIVKREAACFAVPTLFGEGAVTAEGIVNRQNGYIVKNSPEAMAEAIEWSINNMEEHKKIGDNAYKTVYVTWKQKVEEVEEKYKAILRDFNK